MAAGHVIMTGMADPSRSKARDWTRPRGAELSVFCPAKWMICRSTTARCPGRSPYQVGLAPTRRQRRDETQHNRITRRPTQPATLSRRPAPSRNVTRRRRRGRARSADMGGHGNRVLAGHGRTDRPDLSAIKGRSGKRAAKYSVSRRWKHGHASALPLQSGDWSRSGLQPVPGAYWQLSLSWGGLRSGWLEPILAQGFLNVLGAGSFDGLVDRECLA
jgi:hypothetical protein